MIELIQRRLDGYQAVNAIEEEQAIREIIQEIALFALWKPGARILVILVYKKLFPFSNADY